MKNVHKVPLNLVLENGPTGSTRTVMILKSISDIFYFKLSTKIYR